VTAVEPSRDARPSTEDRYRARTEFDEVGFGSHCVDCYPGSCLYRVYVRDGRIIREEVAGAFMGEEETNPAIPDRYPLGCNKGAAWSQQIDSPDRVRHPMRRVGERGSGSWEQISWDEALDELADSLLDTMTEVGAEAIVKEGTPEAAAIAAIDRFLGLIGATITDLNGAINDFSAGHHLTFGKFFPIFGFDEGEQFTSDLLLFWHTNPVYTTISIFHWFQEARYNGTETVLISPDVSPSHCHVDYHVPVDWGSDPALALAMCQVIVEEGLVDEDFVRTQTDLSLLVRTDTERFLRQSDLPGGGRDDQFFHLVDGDVVPASRAHLLEGAAASLEGTATVTFGDGTEVEVRPLMVRLRDHLDGYTPEQARAVTGVHPDTVRTIARKVATSRTRIIMGMGANKAYHSDLYQRTMNLLLALTGNWGRIGAGINCWAATQVDGQVITAAKPSPGNEGAEVVLGMLDAVEDAIREADPTMTDELVSLEMWRGGTGGGGTRGAGTGGMVPPAFFWYWHCGMRERWNNPGFNDPDMARTFDEYVDEALAEGWWSGLERPGPDCPPRVLIECGGNMLRRTRGGRGVLLEHLWPKLEKIVTIDWRWSITALHSDIVLPAAQHYEKVGTHIPIMAMIFSDKVAEPIGEAKPEWEIFALLCRAMERRAAARGLGTWTDRLGVEQRFDALWDRYTLGGAMQTEEQHIDESLRDAAYAEVLPPDATLERVREKGFIRYTNWGRFGMAKGQATPWPEPNHPVNVFSNHVERGEPYPTLTRRAQFLIEHPWFVEAGEDLPVHKPSPKMGGDHPFRMTTGHNRWSIHAMNQANRAILGTHRGEPHIVIHPDDAAARDIADNQRVRCFNDVGHFVVRAKLSPSQRPGGVTVYNGWEGYQFEGWNGPNEVEPSMVKYLGFAGGYGHLRYGPMEWQPVPIDRFVYVDVAPA
jgi:DMSO reductase family type II enzyme molybdopterin subunit